MEELRQFHDLFEEAGNLSDLRTRLDEIVFSRHGNFDIKVYRYAIKAMVAMRNAVNSIDYLARLIDYTARD